MPWTENALAETYSDVEPLIHRVTNAFSRRIGAVDPADLSGEAAIIFLECYDNWNPRIPFEKWLAWKLYRGLLSNARTIARHRIGRRLPPAGSTVRTFRVLDCIGADPDIAIDCGITEDRGWLNQIPDTRSQFDADDFLEGLSDDGRTVAELALYPPVPVIVAAEERWGADKPASLRNAIKEYLGDLGWSLVRIGESFREVAEVLVS